MGVIQHAALHAHEQHMVWRQVIMKIDNTSRSPLSQKKTITKDWMHKTQKSNQSLKTLNYCFGGAAAGLAAAGVLAGAAPGGRINVVVLIQSSLSKLLSR
jgi:hypothetical protein